MSILLSIWAVVSTVVAFGYYRAFTKRPIKQIKVNQVIPGVWAAKTKKLKKGP